VNWQPQCDDNYAISSAIPQTHVYRTCNSITTVHYEHTFRKTGWCKKLCSPEMNTEPLHFSILSTSNTPHQFQSSEKQKFITKSCYHSGNRMPVLAFRLHVHQVK
jgi:hypothetical protein